MRVAFRVTGLRELNRSLRKFDAALGKELSAKLKEAAEPVRRSAIAKLGRYQGVSLNVQPVALVGSVRVRQQQRKVTGLRGDFGALQMRNAFEPALEENADEVFGRVHDAIDGLADSAGL